MAEHRRTLCVYCFPDLDASQIHYIVTTYCNNIQLVLGGTAGSPLDPLLPFGQ
jgi:hypothetical protein